MKFSLDGTIFVDYQRAVYFELQVSQLKVATNYWVDSDCFSYAHDYYTLVSCVLKLVKDSITTIPR